MTRPWSTGATWLRWDPHLHAPGTLQNDGFKGDWDAYLTAIETATPAPSALGVTDYLSMDGYKTMLDHKSKGRLPNVSLLFPNIEMRLTVETRRGNGINVHLLVCPEDGDHVARIESLLAGLDYKNFREQIFRCTRDDLIRLGREHEQNAQLPKTAALRAGVNQFKVDWRSLQRLKNDDKWFRDNVLIAVAAGNDGLSGLGKDAAFSAEREAIGTFADIIFSSNEKQREYWAGHRADFKKKGLIEKPCLHGSDAHSLAAVLAPDLERRCWIRSEPTFDGLRQTLVEPERRVYIGPTPPRGPSEDNVIRTIEIKNAPWMLTSRVSLNDGLVTIIGAKGSGKTALADLAAFGAFARDEPAGEASFISKAREHISDVEVQLEWGDGSRTSSPFTSQDHDEEPRVRYLSQQFVERLCSNAGVAQPLVDEIEAVVFSAIPEEDRMHCSAFSELRDLELRDPLAARENELDRIRRLTEQISIAYQEHSELKLAKAKHAEAKRLREACESALKQLPPPGDPKATAAHEAASRALSALREEIAQAERRRKNLDDLRGALDRMLRAAEDDHARIQETFADLQLVDTEWDQLRLQRHDGALAMLKRLDKKVADRLKNLRAYGMKDQPDPLPSDPVGITQLAAREEKLGKQLGADKANAKRLAKLKGEQARRRKTEAKQMSLVQHAENAPSRWSAADTKRMESYERIFATLDEEKSKLEGLYSPLHQQLPPDGKLAFYVHRRVDTTAWAAAGERILDLRRPPFSGRGTLQEVADKHLTPAWTAGSATEAAAALKGFLTTYAKSAMKARREGVSAQDFGNWAFSTEHIHVEYGIKYEGVPIARLSPGTRGVVLLTLFLGLDRWDERPLIIDQPEENLDPKSVFSELVPFFRQAATRRQIIMVTHNANLVVNTDSDQVIVTSSTRDAPDTLPNIVYEAGGLEDQAIRAAVCSLLEGGEDAFRRRGRRYGMPG
ncbi:MAG: TrlF family AAA-like ATPase [Nannocystales bacterium]